MRAKSPKIYTLPQVAELLGVSIKSVYAYINAGRIEVSGKINDGTPGKNPRAVSETEYLRLKRDGVTSKSAKSSAAAPASTKKPAKGKTAAALTPAKKSAKGKIATAPTLTKKLAKSKAAVASVPKKAAKKQAKRSMTGRSKK